MDMKLLKISVLMLAVLVLVSCAGPEKQEADISFSGSSISRPGRKENVTEEQAAEIKATELKEGKAAVNSILQQSLSECESRSTAQAAVPYAAETKNETVQETKTERKETEPEPEQKSQAEEKADKSSQHKHEFLSKITRKATCSEPGIRTWYCSCGISYPENIQATGEHQWTEVCETLHHDAATETIWVTDRAAWNETVTVQVPAFTVKIFDKNTGTWGTEKKYVTGKDGKFTIDNLYSGDTVSVTETKAPKGYLIPSQPAQTLKLAPGSNALTFKDDPTFDPATPTVYKARYENGKIIAGDPVKDAVFKVEYFDNINREGTAKRTWYFITDVEGTFLYQPECLAEGYKSDALYVDKFGIYEMPLGSVRMTEVKSPAGFLKYTGTLEGIITQNKESGLAEFAWVTPETSEVKPDGGTVLLGEKELVIAVDKIDRGTGKSLPGAVLQLKQGNTVLKEWTTDGSVMQIRNILTAGQTYQIHEAGAPKGYKTAPDIIFSIDEEGNINVLSADIDTFVTAEGYLGVKMEDTEMIMLPLTGSTGGLWVILTGVGLLAAGTTAWFVTRRRKISLKSAGKKIICTIAVLISAAALTVPAYAAGNIEVVRKGTELKTYKAYTLMEGSYEDGKLWNIRLAEGIPEKTWEKIGAPEKFLGNGQLLASWLSVKLESDIDGSFVRMLADHVTRAEEPGHVFRSGETISVTDGYYLVVADDSYPMLFLTGGGETKSIYEKLIPKDYPKTGDAGKILPYVLCAAAGAAGIAAGTIFISSSRRKKEDEE